MTSLKRLLKTSPRLALSVAALGLAGTGGALAATEPAAPVANTTYTTHGSWSFVSAPGLHPPKIRTDAPTARRGLAHGDFLVANFRNLLSSSPFDGQSGPLILGSHLQPVWFLPVSGAYTNNLTAQTYEGKPALSWWQGVVTSTGATTQGEDIVVNQHYEKVATLVGGDGWVITQHEMRIVGHDAWVTANKVVTVQAGQVPNCPTCTQVVDSAAQEYDLTKPAGSPPIYSWDAMTNVPLTASMQHASPSFPWDAYHINSVQPVSGGSAGRLLVSLRNTWAAYLIDIATGKTIWTIGGPSSTFKLPANGQFQWQHDVELHSGGLLTLFDDACCEVTGPGQLSTPVAPSRGLLLKLDTTNDTVSYVHQYVHPEVGGSPIETGFQGNMDLLPDGNVIIGWGSAPFVSEFSNSGKLLFDAKLPGPDITYRAYLTNWVGLPPISQLRQTAKESHGKTTVYVSWNGATQVVAWRVLGGPDAGHLHTIATAGKSGFETAIALPKTEKTYKVQALNGQGRVIGTSSAFGTGAKPPVYGGY